MKAKIAQVDAQIAQQQRLAEEASAQKVGAEQKLSLVEKELVSYQELALRDPTRNIPLVAKAIRDYLQKRTSQVPAGLLDAEPSFAAAKNLLRQFAPNFGDLAGNNLYQGMMKACDDIETQ